MQDADSAAVRVLDREARYDAEAALLLHRAQQESTSAELKMLLLEQQVARRASDEVAAAALARVQQIDDPRYQGILLQLARGMARGTLSSTEWALLKQVGNNASGGKRYIEDCITAVTTLVATGPGMSGTRELHAAMPNVFAGNTHVRDELYDARTRITAVENRTTVVESVPIC